MPWNIRFGGDEARRYLAEPWVRERVGEEGALVIGRGVLPVRERDRQLQCVFLDDDMLCSMQKRFGHEYIPKSCQAFPFGFVRDEKDVVVAQLSQLCPSIRDNYGKPVDRQLKAKLQQRGDTERMSTALATLSGVILAQPLYLRAARHWEERLATGASPASTLAELYDWTAAFERALPQGQGRATDASVDAALGQAGKEEPEPLAPRKRPSFYARVLFAYLLGNLCYPSRVRESHRVEEASWTELQALRSFGNKAAWMLGRGTVDMLFVPRPFKLQRVSTVDRFLAGDEGTLVKDYLRLVLQRRHIFSAPRHLLAAVLDLSLATVVISRFARCRAAADGRVKVSPEDVREGISVAELVLLSHAALSEQGTLMKNLRWLLLTKRESFRALLATEA
ncbi:YkgJ family cysteine cluster protein [Sorangium atrum]|uniref:YkgJ family cysteine cluster protein n=1 Tax=Sorangium atrum TaxID=2995308 RepID=A0ABT5C451_9BACT|nr:YkgJ family cysteine cluster protein [Sorangium aterium]MDC0679957.1 YkgJ family cysteine cluster protein [Sorangium aterium]